MKPELILPTGTQVVSRVETRGVDGRGRPAGAAGRIVCCPVDSTHSYRVRFPDGGEVSLLRRDLVVLKKHQMLEPSEARTGVDELQQFVIYRCVIGSRAYGLDDVGSDTDRRGVYLPPAEMHWSLYGVPEQLEEDATQECYWELRKFLVLALKANPNVLECLYTPIVEHASEIAAEMLSIRDSFLSRLIYQTYNGYVMSQFKKLDADIRNHGAIKWKHAMHLVRLLLSGIVALREGIVPVHVGEHRDRLLAIRRGELSWEQVNFWRIELHGKFDDAFASTRLPEQPDYDRANALLIRARRSMV